MVNRACLITSLCIILFAGSYAQGLSHLDSLELQYTTGNYKAANKLKILKELANTHPNAGKVLIFSDALIAEARAVDSVEYLIAGIQEKGNACRIKGDNSQALENYFEAAKIAVDRKLSHALGILYVAIADVYSSVNNHNNAVDYYRKAVAILRAGKDSVNVANTLYNWGDHYLQINQPDSARIYTKEAQFLFNTLRNDLGEAYCLGNLGRIYCMTGDELQGETYLNKAIDLLQQQYQYPAICEYLVSVSDIYKERNDIERAKVYAYKSLELAGKNGLKNEISDANLKLSELFEKSGDAVQSFFFYREHIKYRDSVNNIQSVQQMADLRTDFEVAKKQKEVDLLETRNRLRIAERNGFVFASLLLAGLLLASIYFYTQKVKRNKMMLAQKIQEAEIVHQKALLQSVITSQEAERKRIGMDLHDEVGAALSTLRIKIEKFAAQDAKAGEQASFFKSDIDKIIANMRNISHSLSPRISGSFGFYDAVYELSDNVNRSGKLNMQVNFDESKLPVFAEEQAPMAIYRVLSELINNTMKHASATNIYLDVIVENEWMTMHYRDDGIGISGQQSVASKGMGMQNIESRLGIIRATWRTEIPAGGGYGVFISIPLK